MALTRWKSTKLMDFWNIFEWKSLKWSKKIMQNNHGMLSYFIFSYKISKINSSNDRWRWLEQLFRWKQPVADLTRVHFSTHFLKSTVSNKTIMIVYKNQNDNWKCSKLNRTSRRSSWATSTNTSKTSNRKIHKLNSQFLTIKLYFYRFLNVL